MPSDAMRVWVDVHQAYCGGSIHMKLGDSRAAAAVIERAIAEAVEKERARIERLKGYAVHDDICEDHGDYPGSCTCGLSRLLKEIGDGQ